MLSKEIRFYRDQAEKCRALARLADELRQRLTAMAGECDDRARSAESPGHGARTESKLSPPSQPREMVEPLVLSIKDATRLIGLSRSTIYKMIGDGQLETIKIGRRTLIRTASIRSLVEIRD